MPGTQLFIKIDNNDNGSRPLNPCGPPNYYWDSQAVWLTDPTNASITKTKAKVGEKVRVNVRITNKSAQQTEGDTAVAFPDQDGFGNQVKVQIWVCNYGVGVGPQGAIASAGGAAGLTVPPIGAAIPIGGTQVASGDWTPQPGDLNINTTAAGEGHVCVAANVYWEGTTPPLESQEITSGVLALCGDGAGMRGGHHGQKNILIAKAGTTLMKIPMNIFGFGDGEQVFLIEVLEARGLAALRLAERETMLAEPWIALVGGARKVKPKTVAGKPIEPIERARLRAGGRLVLKSSQRPIKLSRGRVENLRLEADGAEAGEEIRLKVGPKRPKQIELHWEQRKELPGAVHVFDVLQRDRRRRLLGGARIVAVRTR
jgi:hypothetical protein